VKQVDTASRKAGLWVWLAADKLGASDLGAIAQRGLRAWSCHARTAVLSVVVPQISLCLPCLPCSAQLGLKRTVGEKFHRTTHPRHRRPTGRHHAEK